VIPARRGAAVAGLVLVTAVMAACGKRGDPLPPLRPVPARIADLRATRTAAGVTVTLTVPTANTDGTTPVAVDRIEIYSVIGATAAPSPTPAQIVANPANRRATFPVQVPVPAPSSAAAAPPASTDSPQSRTSAAAMAPAPGDPISWTDPSAATATPDTAVHYVAVAVVGRGRGRRSPLSPVVTVPFGPLPPAPVDVKATNDETAIHVTWTPPVAGDTYVVLTSAGPFDAAAAQRASEAPLPAPPFSMPVEFGHERCFAVRTIHTAGSTTIEGGLSAPGCVTPVDVYPPAAPANLQAIQEGSAVTLTWTAPDAKDLAGYVILRSEGGADMQPLMRAPIPETTYKDQQVRTGVTYTYSVYAVDTAPAANVSQQSNRQTVTIR
jgi:hypothetical protein